MIRRIGSLAIKEFIHLRNDWWLPAFMLFGGILELLLVGWATSRPITNLPIMVFDQSKSPASQQIVTALENTGTFRTPQDVSGMSPIRSAMEQGTISAALIIPPDFSEQLAASTGQPSLSVILNGADSTSAMAAERAVQGVVATIDQRIVVQRFGLDPVQLSAFNPSVRVLFNENLTEAFYTVPAELGLMLEFTVLLFAALGLSRERELGTLEQLLVMPFSSLEIMIGKAIPVILVGFTDFVLMLTMVHFAFGVPVRGSLILLLVLAFLYLLVELGKGMVISVISRSQHQALLLVLLVGMVDFMFTGYAAPVEGMPKVLQYIANIIPANHWLNILRGILLKGAGLDVLWPQIAALLGLGLVIGLFSWRFVRRALD